MNDPEQRRRVQHIALIAGLTLFAACLRLYELGGKSLWFDEALFFWATQADLEQVVALNASVRASPPLYSFVIHFWSALGDSEWWLRLPAWFAGVAAVPVSYLVARHFVPPGAALFGAMLVATSERHVEFSQRVGEYGFGYLAAAAVILAFARYRAKPEARQAIVVMVLAALAPLVQYGIGILVGALLLAFVIDAYLDPSRRGPPASIGIVLAPLAVAAAIAWFQLGVGEMLASHGPGSDGYLSRAYWDGSIVSLVRLVAGSTFDIFDYSHSMGGVVLLLCVIGVANIPRHRGETWIALALAIALVGTLAAALLGLYPYAGKRHIFFLLPLIFLTASIGVARLQRIEPLAERRVLVGALAAIVALSGAYECLRYVRSDEPEHMRPVAAKLLRERAPEDAVYLYSPAVPAGHYYLSQADPALRRELGARAEEWLPRLVPLDLAPHAQDASTPVRFAPCPDDDCDRVPHLGNETRRIEIDRLNATFGRAERVWMLLSHCREDDCERLMARAASCGALEKVSEASHVALYLALPSGACSSVTSAHETNTHGDDPESRSLP